MGFRGATGRNVLRDGVGLFPEAQGAEEGFGAASCTGVDVIIQQHMGVMHPSDIAEQNGLLRLVHGVQVACVVWYEAPAASMRVVDWAPFRVQPASCANGDSLRFRCHKSAPLLGVDG